MSRSSACQRERGPIQHRRLPDIVVDLNGAIHITLVGFIDSVNLCRVRNRAKLDFRAQNGKKQVTNPFVQTGFRNTK